MRPTLTMTRKRLPLPSASDSTATADAVDVMVGHPWTPLHVAWSTRRLSAELFYRISGLNVL